MKTYLTQSIEKRERIDRLVADLFAEMPQIEAERAVLLTESYRQTEGEPIVMRRAKAFAHILDNIPITIRDGELIVGSATLRPRSCQAFPEYSFEWLQAEFDTVEKRSADPFFISEEAKQKLREAFGYWKGKTVHDLAESYMAPQTLVAMEHNMFTPNNYFFGGVGHVTVDYAKVLRIGFNGIADEARAELGAMCVADPDYIKKGTFLQAVIICCEAVGRYAARYADLARNLAAETTDPDRFRELVAIADTCDTVPACGARSFYEACQSFWFVQMLLQMESSGHSISPGRFDQYMYPYYKADLDQGKLTVEDAQELIDCIWVKLNDLNKVRDAQTAEGFAGYSLFQNLICGGQNADGIDVTNDLSFLCIEASMHVHLPQPSLSVRVWNGSPQEFLLKAAELTRTGIGLPAYYNDEVIIPALVGRGLTLEDARDYNIIGCVEPQKAGKTDGWHDAAFFNMCRPLELVFSQGRDTDGTLVGVETPDVTTLKTFDAFYDAYKTQMNYMIRLLVNADNAIDVAHATLCPLPFESCMVSDCIGRGKSVQEGGAVYNFTGPQGFGVANMADSLYAIRRLVYEEHSFSMTEYRTMLAHNYGRSMELQSAKELTRMICDKLLSHGCELTDAEKQLLEKRVIALGDEKYRARGDLLLRAIAEIPKYGNDNAEVDAFARDVAYTYTRPLEAFRNPRGGMFQAGLYPVSANVPLGAQTGATPDGRLAGTPIADGVSPAAGRDVNGPTASANSVARLDHFIASNGTLFNMKFHPSALKGEEGLSSFVALIRAYFDQKGSHMQFNVVSRETLLDAQQHPENYKGLVVRVAGYSALFTTLSRSLQDDIIRRTEQVNF